MRTTICALLTVAMLCTNRLWASEDTALAVRPRVEEKSLIQVALLIDTSGSMNGLIDQAKTQLWKVVNEFARAKRHGQRPEIQVALFEYGKQSLPQSSGYLRMIVPLSTNLDKISEELFALTTNGGSEYCGWTIKSATEGLSWSSSTSDLKAIFRTSSILLSCAPAPTFFKQRCQRQSPALSIPSP